MRISAIRLKHLTPFEDVTLEFPKKQEERIGEVQIITGQNGTGKTRFLCALASVLGNPTNLASRTSETIIEFGASVETLKQDFFCWQGKQGILAGTIKTGDAINNLKNGEVLRQHRPDFSRMTDFPGLRISLTAENELFSALAFRGTTKVNDSTVVPMKTLPVSNYVSNLDFDRADQSEFVLQAMTNLKMASAMEYLSKPNDDATPHSRSTQIMSRLEAAVSTVSGKPFSFEVVPHPELRIRVRWGKDRMGFGVLPDGLRSIIGFLVSCASRMAVDFPEHENPLDIPIVILMDEPETHLHPAWQQRLIPAAQQLLPNSQMFVVTHSPFVISSVNSGYVHVLTEKEGKISVSEPMVCSKGDTWVDAVEDALGLKTWYDPETETMLAEFRNLRQAVLLEEKGMDELQSLASRIASRSQSLSQMMGREMVQVTQILEKAIASK